MYIGVVGHVVALGKGGTRDGRRSGAARESEERTAADQRPVARLRGARTAMTDNATMRFIPFLLILPDLSTAADRSEEHTSELQSLMRISYAVFCLKKKNIDTESYIIRQ